MLTEERQKAILDLLAQHDIIKVQTLVKELKSSESTIRRDFLELESAGLLRRIHGGATRIVKVELEPNIAEKSSKNIHEKTTIAAYCANLVADGDFIYLDAGTSTYQMIPYLSDKNIQVVTNSVYHASALVELEIPTIIIGGNVKPNTKAVISAFSLKQLESYRFDKAFLGINGVHPTYGFSTPDPEEASMKAVAMTQSERVFVLADHSKFQKVSFAKVADLSAGMIITTHLEPTLAKELAKLTTIKEVNA